MLQITHAERQTLQLLADEKPASEIAMCLGIALSDVGSHLAVLFARMGVATKTEAASNALRRGLLIRGAPETDTTMARRPFDEGHHHGFVRRP